MSVIRVRVCVEYVLCTCVRRIRIHFEANQNGAAERCLWSILRLTAIFQYKYIRTYVFVDPHRHGDPPTRRFSCTCMAYNMYCIYIYKYIYIQVYIIHCIYSHKENIKFNERTRQKRQRAFDVVGNAVGPNRSEEPLEVASTLTGHRDRAARKIELTIDVLAMGWLRCGSVLFGFEMLRANSPKSASLDQRKVYGLAFHRE